MGALTDADAPIKIKFLGEVLDKAEIPCPFGGTKNGNPARQAQRRDEAVPEHASHRAEKRGGHAMERRSFGFTRDKQPVDILTLDNGQLRCSVLTYGAALAALSVPAADGSQIDVALGFDSMEDYQTQDKFVGAIVGRYANRIAGGRFSLEGKTYTLALNDGENHLHGGPTGFANRVWTAEECPDGVCLHYESKDGEEGYPGALSASIIYRLEGSSLILHYQAAADRTTVCNLTSHAYWNLNGQGSGSAMGHTLTLFADRYTPVVPGSIPTGAVDPVEGTPLDFRTPRVIGERVDEPFRQLELCGGYDHNWVINGPTGTLRPAARLEGDKSGVILDLETTLPGVQFYSSNYLDGCPAGKGGARYARRDAVCLETQFYPDSPNHPDFPSCVLRPGETWDHTTVLRFSHR